MSNMYASDDEGQARRAIKRSIDFVCFTGVALALVFGIAGIVTEFAPTFFGRGFHGFDYADFPDNFSQGLGECDQDAVPDPFRE